MVTASPIFHSNLSAQTGVLSLLKMHTPVSAGQLMPSRRSKVQHSSLRAMRKPRQMSKAKCHRRRNIAQSRHRRDSRETQQGDSKHDVRRILKRRLCLAHYEVFNSLQLSSFETHADGFVVYEG